MSSAAERIAGLHGVRRQLSDASAGGSVKFQRKLAAGHAFVVLLVGPHDALHQAVAHHVALVEMDET